MESGDGVTTHSSFTVLASWPHPQCLGDICVEFSPLFNRQPTPLDDTLIEQPWAAKLERCAKELAAGSPAKLFNGTKFRLHKLMEDRGNASGAMATRTTSAAVRPPAITLQLGITDYKSSIGCVEGIASLTAFASEQQQQCHPPSLMGAVGEACVEPYLAQALGVESLLVTSDNCAILFRRSMHVAEMPGWYCCPGGHPEPKQILSQAAADSMSLEMQADWFARVASPIVVRELLDAAVDEVCAEVGVDRKHLSNRGLIGVVLNTATKKPDLVVLVSTTLTAHEVSHVFNKREAEEVFESEEGEGVVAVPFTSVDVEQALLQYRLTPPSAACLKLGLAVAIAAEPK